MRSDPPSAQTASPAGEGRGEDLTAAEMLHGLLTAQRALRSRWDDFRGALGRRDDAAYRLGLSEFFDKFCRWSMAEEKILLPVLARFPLPGRDAQRELHLEYVQIRELTRHLLSLVRSGGGLGDILGFVENLERRIAAHESEMEKVYYPAAAAFLTPEQWRILQEAAPAT